MNKKKYNPKVKKMYFVMAFPEDKPACPLRGPSGKLLIFTNREIAKSFTCFLKEENNEILENNIMVRLIEYSKPVDVTDELAAIAEKAIMNRAKEQLAQRN